MRTRVLIGVVVALLLAAAVLVWPGGLGLPDDDVAGTPMAEGRADPAALPDEDAAPDEDGAPAGAGGIGDEYFPEAGNGGYDVAGYEIDIRYDPETDELAGRTTVTAAATDDLSAFNLDLRLAAGSATVDGADAKIDQDGGELTVTPADPLQSGDEFTVVVEYAGVPSEIDGGAEAVDAWARTDDGAVAIGQPDIAAWWYPSNDHPSDKATIAVTATVPSGVEVISNGALLGGPESAGNGQDRWRWRADEPMATYLAFVAIGQYEIVRRDTEFGLYLAAYAEGLDPDVARAARASVEQTPQITRFLAGIIGEYPFSQLGGVVPADPDLGFALENQTRPVYGEAFFAGGEEVGVVVHELAHQWFGDSVAISRWRDIWLNEGFATYFEWLYSERTGGPSAQDIAGQQYDRIPADADFWEVPPGDPGAPNLLDGAVYLRGALALHALRTTMGDDDFFATLRAWAAERAGGNGTVEDFLAVAERVSGTELDDIAQEWLYAKQRPVAPPG